MTKTQMKKLLKKLQEDHKSQQEYFMSLGKEGEGGGGGVGEETGEDFKFLISSTDPSCIKRNIHMPGYPE